MAFPQQDPGKNSKSEDACIETVRICIYNTIKHLIEIPLLLYLYTYDGTYGTTWRILL